MQMSRTHVDHKEIASFAQNKVNLPQDKANKYRAQARQLREKLENYLNEHPDFTLKKMMVSGSLAKGTALRTLNDIDVACYVSGVDAPSDVPKLLDYIAEKLRKAFPNFTPDQVKPQTYCITVSFKGTGLDVDIVPILYYGDDSWYGNLVSQDDGSFLKTSIPLHLDFIKKRKQKHDQHYSQVVRLIKFWARKEKRERDGFRFKSFMIELILAKLSDNGTNFSDYPEALQSFFTYIATTDMRKLIVFDDYYENGKVGSVTTPIKIMDPVNEVNNVSALYTSTQADMIVDAAIEAGDAIDSALSATTKQDTVYYWQKIFGPSFQV
jgi:tRNA nucleotidyltransferase (CCA-adding enzyme)|tara:strand:+ start:4914 stop:5885 length:972 start_codon:yes stop_codon:yes gene_type:complete